jgi:hypothetical protein
MQGCRSVLLMLVMRMMVVLVVLMVLEELVVFVGGIFENSISPIKKIKKYYRIQNENFWCKKKSKNP